MSWIVVDESGRRASATCAHVDVLASVEPSTRDGCEDCLAEGSTRVHLRECLNCGHIGCCDNSPRRHATAHWHESDHPMVRSFEPGEEWAWCYADELLLVATE